MTSLPGAFAAVLAMSLRAAFFRSPHRLLPDAVNVRSTGSAALFAGFWVAGMLRHAAVVGLPPDVVATNMALYSVLLLAIAAVRAAEVSLYLAASIGVDLTLAAVTGLGLVNSTNELLRGFALAWELSATVAAIARRRADRRASGDAR